jgi:hypothetical protein
MQTIQLPDATEHELDCYKCLLDTDFRHESAMCKRNSRRENTDTLMLSNETLFRFRKPYDDVLAQRAGRINGWLRWLSEYLFKNSPRAKVIRDSLVEFVEDGSLVVVNSVYSLGEHDPATELDHLVIYKFKQAMSQDRASALELFEQVLARAPSAQLALFKYDIEELTGAKSYRQVVMSESYELVRKIGGIEICSSKKTDMLTIVGRHRVPALGEDNVLWFYTNGQVDLLFSKHVKLIEKKRVTIPPTGFERIAPSVGAYRGEDGVIRLIVNCNPFMTECEGDVVYEDSECIIIVV